MVSNSGTMLIARRSVAAQSPTSLSRTPTSSRSLDRVALGDDVVRQRPAPKRAWMCAAAARIASSLARAFGVLEMRRTQEARAGELARKQRHARGLVERRVVRVHAGAREQLRHDGLVHVGVLPQVERREVEAEHACCALQRSAVVRPRAVTAPCAAQRRGRSRRDRRRAPPRWHTARASPCGGRGRPVARERRAVAARRA